MFTGFNLFEIFFMNHRYTSLFLFLWFSILPVANRYLRNNRISFLFANPFYVMHEQRRFDLNLPQRLSNELPTGK